MKDFITVNINPDHNTESGTNILGREGEGSISRLEINIPEALLGYDIYIDFKKPNGDTVRTPRLEVEGSVAYYDVPLYILSEGGEIEIQIVFQSKNEEIWKSSVKKYTIQKSINAIEDIPDKEDFITEAQKILDELSGEVAEIANILANNKDFVDTVTNHLDMDKVQPKQDEALITTDKTIVGAINELNTAIIGHTWKLHNLNLRDNITKTFNFVSNGEAFTKFEYMHPLSVGNFGFNTINYYRADDTKVCAYHNGWMDDAYQTIVTADAISLTDIAEKITVEVVPNLTTKAKTLVGAINELSQNMVLKGAYRNPLDGKWYSKYVNGEFLEEVVLSALSGGDKKFVLFDYSLFEIEMSEGAMDSYLAFCKDTLNKVWDTLPDNFKEETQELVDKALEGTAKVLEGVNNWIDNTASPAVQGVIEFIGDVGDGTFGEAVGQKIAEANQGIQDWIEDVGKQTADKLNEIVEFFGGDLVPDSNFAQITEDSYSTFVKTNSIDTLETADTTVVGGINELTKILKGNTWVLNNTFNFQANFKKDFVFVSNGATFKAIEGIFGWDESSEEYYQEIYYWKPDGTKVLVYTDGLGWSWKPEYQTIFTYNTGILLKDIATIKNEAIVGAIKGLNNEITNEIDAVKRAIEEGRIIPACALEAQNLRDEDQLETDAKTVIDAINELARQALNTLGYIHTHYDNPQNIKETASGITWRDKYELDAGVVRTGDIYHKVPIVAGNNVSFEVDETNKVVKINSSGGGNVDTSNLATVDKIGEIYNNEGDTEIAYADESGIAWADTFGIYDDNGETIKYGALYPHIPLVAGNGIEFEIDEENQKVKINATGGGSDDSIVGTWVFKDEPTFEGIAYAVPYYFNFSDASGQSYSFIEFLNQDYGVSANFIRYCTEAFYNTAYVSQPAAWLSGGWVGDHYKTITITEEPTDETFISWLKANATKQSGTSKAEMPQIRFVSMPCSGWYGDIDWYAVTGDQQQDYREQYNLKFTIEIVGGGALQVGDAIQICRMGKYGASESYQYGVGKPHPPKRKLRRLVEYTITEEDLKKRFITFDVAWDDKKAIKLFTKHAIFGVNDDTMYFRIRRPKGGINSGDNGGGMTVDAEFSNVVSVRRRTMNHSWYDEETGEDIKYYQIRIV